MNDWHTDTVLRRIVALIFIFVCTAIAWGVLGATIFSRTYNTGPGLRAKVQSSWGTPQVQRPPGASYSVLIPKETKTTIDGRVVENVTKELTVISLPLDRSDIDVSIALEHRQKGLLWYSTYRVAFGGLYVFRNDTAEERTVSIYWPFPSEKAIYDELALSVDGQPLAYKSDKAAITATVPMPAGATRTVRVTYRSQGLDTWAYEFGSEVSQVRDFRLHMTTDFEDIDFPENSLSPTEKRLSGKGWELTWRYRNLVSGYNIAMAMPAKLQPGPLAGEISFFAPVSLFFFFFVMFIITTLRGLNLHPMNYFFLAAAFFSFHLLLAYLVDHISIHLAFVICSIVSVSLVVSYLRLVVGMRFALRDAGLAQLVYLVLFSYAFFFKGFTGLAVTIGAILTLFVVMQVTGRLNWSQQFRAVAPESGR